MISAVITRRLRFASSYSAQRKIFKREIEVSKKTAGYLFVSLFFF
jgi:hypothetical protein